MVDYVVTAQEANAQQIANTFLRVWAFALEDRSYALAENGNPASGFKAGVSVPAVTDQWDVPRETAGGQWAVIMPNATNMPLWTAPVIRSGNEIGARLTGAVGLTWAQFRAAAIAAGIDMTGVTPSTQISLTIEQWCNGLIEGSGPPRTIETDDGTLFPGDGL